MDKKTKLAWLKRYSETNAVSGFEAPMKELMQERLAGKAEVSYDKLGSVVFTSAAADENAPKIMLASHMDEIGFMVKHITKEGFLKFVCLGGWWEQVMLGQRVTVHGSKGDLVGVIGSKPPHILTPEERTKVVQKRDMYIDIGVEDEKEVKPYLAKPGITVSAALLWRMLWIIFPAKSIPTPFTAWRRYRKKLACAAHRPALTC